MEHRNPRGILVKRSVSEVCPQNDHDHEASQYRKSSLSLCRIPGNNDDFVIQGQESLKDSLPRPSIQTARIAAVQIQSTISPQRKLPTIKAECDKDDEIAEAPSSSVKYAIPRRTVSFAPVHQIRRPSISDSASSTPSVRHSNVSFREDLPRALQAGTRSDIPAWQGLRPSHTSPTPRQLALWEEDELKADAYGQGRHLERPLKMAEEATAYLKMRDKETREIARDDTWKTLGILGDATPGYVAAMRRQHYANVYASFRHPQRGLAKSPVAIPSRPSHHKLASISLKLEHEEGWESAREDGTKRSKSLRQVALES